MPKHYRHWIEMQVLNRLIGVHSESLCEGQVCVIHNPTEHHMRDWPLQWRGDRSIMERICHHSVGHPDPDHFPRWKKMGWEANALHGCCGCCLEVPA